ncbi:MAG: TIGR03936 family radical SAM-associated protein [Dethiobacteria bacterium]|jgi:radical SAM-linked protein
MYQYRLCFSKEGSLKYISHLDLQRTFSRVLRRAAVPVAYSRGFNPQPRLRFALPLALGIEGKNEYLDLYLNVPWKENKLKETLNAQLPGGLKVKNVTTVNSKQPSLSSLVQAALYVVCLDIVPVNLSQELDNLLRAESIYVERRGKKSTKKVEIRPFLYKLEVRRQGERGMLLMLLAAGSQGSARPQEVLELLPLGGVKTKTYRAALFISTGGELKTPAGISVERYLEVFYGKEDCD